eukprot:gene17700-biopygen5096
MPYIHRATKILLCASKEEARKHTNRFCCPAETDLRSEAGSNGGGGGLGTSKFASPPKLAHPQPAATTVRSPSFGLPQYLPKRWCHLPWCSLSPFRCGKAAVNGLSEQRALWGESFGNTNVRRRSGVPQWWMMHCGILQQPTSMTTRPKFVGHMLDLYAGSPPHARGT